MPASRNTSTINPASAPASASPTTARWSPAPGIAACGSAKARRCRASATWDISISSSLGKLELDMMGSQQMSERQVLEAIIAEAIANVFEEYVDKTRPGRDRRCFRQGRENRGRRHAAVVAVRRAAQARAEGVGQGVRGQRRRKRSGSSILFGVRPGGTVCHRSYFTIDQAWAHHLRTVSGGNSGFIYFN